jgi:hypothetical protein
MAAPIPQELIADTLHELEQEFGAVSCETQAILGLTTLCSRSF